MLLEKCYKTPETDLIKNTELLRKLGEDKQIYKKIQERRQNWMGQMYAHCQFILNIIEEIRMAIR